MSRIMEAPNQYKQPSRKGKKAWRKYVDVSEIQKGVEVVREEEIRGGLVSEKPSEELFRLDSTPSTEILKQVRKQCKALKADEILSQRSSIPAVDTRKRGNSIVTDGVIVPKIKKQRTDWVSHKEWHRLKKVALEHRPMKTNEGEVTHDPWEDNVQPSPYDDPRLNFLEKPKPIVAPSTLERKPISLAANGKPIPAIRKPDAGISYNPTFEDWDTLIVREGEKEIEAEKKRLEVLRKDEERKRLIAEAKDGDGEIKSDDESAWEGFESDYEKAEWLNKKLPKRKTLAERNRIKRRKEAERKAKWEAQTRKRDQQGEHITSIATKVKEEEEARQRLQGRSDSSDEGDDVVLRRRPLGKNFPPEKPLELVLPDELQDSLRLLKPEGNLLDDRFRNLIVRGKLEARRPVSQPKKAKRKATEKWSYKDFKVPGV